MKKAARLLRLWALTLLICFAASAVPLACSGAGEKEREDPPTALTVSHSPNTATLALHDLFELIFRHEGKYEDPFFDVDIEVTFTSPGGRDITVGGFFYGSEEAPEIIARETEGEQKFAEYRYAALDTWKARFAPGETGTWRYAYVFRDREGGEARGSGRLTCIEGGNPLPGFVRQSPVNPFRWVRDDGSPFIPVGFQDCHSDWSASGSLLDTAGMEGPFRPDSDEPLPEGPLYVRGPGPGPQNKDVYFRTFSRVGFNLYRFSQQNCSLSLYEDLERYYVHEARMVDELLLAARRYGFAVLYGIFGYHEVFNTRNYEGKDLDKVKRFIKYSVDRWGAMVDFWQFLNEQNASDFWYETMIPYLESVDPYDHPISTSWERPELQGIDVNTPHWYGNESELFSDRLTRDKARDWKAFGKPVIVGEQGNSAKRGARAPGVGGVWDAGSARRMRIRLWTAFFNEISLVFWNTSYARDGHYMNIWLGPREREYVRALQDFCSRVDADAAVVPLVLSRTREVRGYALESRRTLAVYLHHFSDHDAAVEDLELNLDVPAAGKGYWYSPSTAEILGSFDASAGQMVVTAPSFVVDLALLALPHGESAPDVDRDGLPNDADPDDDEDGVPDAEDAFPLDPSEWADRDADLIGDNFDSDDDGDGEPDDRNADGTPDHEELDFDGDGINRSQAVPWDAFPLDPTEWADADGDGIGDNADSDDDGDGFTDSEERAAGTDPENRLSFPLKK